MHWRHVSITTTPCWGSRLVALRARAMLGERWRSQSVCEPGPARRYGMQGLARWLHAWQWRTWQCLVWPPTCGGALLWCHMRKVYCIIEITHHLNCAIQITLICIHTRQNTVIGMIVTQIIIQIANFALVWKPSKSYVGYGMTLMFSEWRKKRRERERHTHLK